MSDIEEAKDKVMMVRKKINGWSEDEKNLLHITKEVTIVH